MNQKKGTILVVDDSRVSQTHLVQILQDEYVIHAASGGVEAIQVAKAAKPDIILLDIVMPQMDGYEVLTALREAGETRDIPVIFITSLDQESDEEKGLRLGAVDYISKPYNPIIVKLRISLQLKISEQMRQINELSMMDAVSKLPNRRYFDKRLREEWQRALSENRQLGILMIDVDKLRTYNAIYGYSHGDECLLAVAGIISENALLSPGDVAARWAYGGFAVLILNATGGECSTIGENIRKAVESLSIPNPDGDGTNVTISIGANAILPSSETSIEQFISNADSALYLAKELGRNQVVVNS
ncbi:MAG: diguanylate cyclase [Defluviitaleaceae bacterium]|nr:diguanylate cyclase [Defluviitaleaceae bacterium]